MARRISFTVIAIGFLGIGCGVGAVQSPPLPKDEPPPIVIIRLNMTCEVSAHIQEYDISACAFGERRCFPGEWDLFYRSRQTYPK